MQRVEMNKRAFVMVALVMMRSSVLMGAVPGSVLDKVGPHPDAVGRWQV